MQGVDRSIWRGSACRGCQSLTGYLAAEDPLRGVQRTVATEDIDLKLIEVEHAVDEHSQLRAHGTPFDPARALDTLTELTR